MSEGGSTTEEEYGSQSVFVYRPKAGAGQNPRGTISLTGEPKDFTTSFAPDGSFVSTNGRRNVGQATAVVIDTRPDGSCGWRFDHWELHMMRKDDPDGVVTTTTEREHVLVLPSIAYDGDWVLVDCYPIYTFEGTGLILRTSSGAVIRSHKTGMPLRDV